MDKQRRIELFHLTRTIVAVAPYLKGTDKNKIIKENKKIILGEVESKNRSLNSFQREIIKRAQQKALKDKQRK